MPPIPSEPPTFTYPKICLLGDSLTRRSMDPDAGCWASLLQNWVIDTFDVHVRGMEGCNSKWLLEMLPKCFKRSFLENCEVMVVFIGANDAWDWPYMHVPVAQYMINLEDIIDYLTKYGLKMNKLIFVTAPWYYKPSCDEYFRQAQLPPMSKSLQICSQYARGMVELARFNDIRYLDFFSMTRDHQPLSELFVDGLHLSRKGAEMLYKGLYPLIDNNIQRDYCRPTADIKHIKPFDQKPEIAAVLEEYRKQFKQPGDDDVNVTD